MNSGFLGNFRVMNRALKLIAIFAIAFAISFLAFALFICRKRAIRVVKNTVSMFMIGMSIRMIEYARGHVGNPDLADFKVYLYDLSIVKAFWCFARIVAIKMLNFVIGFVVEMRDLPNHSDPSIHRVLVDRQSGRFMWVPADSAEGI